MANAGVDADSVRTPHKLNGVEVYGIKQMPHPDATAVTRITAGEVRRLGIDAVKNLGDIVPNLYTPDYGSRMTSSMYIRGLGSRMDQAVMGLSIDGVPVLNKDAYDFDLPDIASIEVLRGAQSVLNGRNAIGGQINIYTLTPLRTRGWRFMAEYGRGNTAKASAAGYFQLSDTWYTSVSTALGHTDGFWRNSFNGARVGRENWLSARWKTVWQPSARLTATNTAAVNLVSQSGYPYAKVSSGQIAYNDTCFYHRTGVSDGLTIAWAGKRVVVTSLTSVQYIDDNMTLDQDFTPADYFTLTQARTELTLTQDLFTKGTRGKYEWLGGVFGFWRRSKMHAPVTFFDTGIANLIENNANQFNPEYPIRWDDRSFLLDSRFRTPTTGFAIYHQSAYHLDGWTIEAGLRWDLEHVSCRYLSSADATYTIRHLLPDGTYEPYGQVPVDIKDYGKLSSTFNRLLPKLTISRRLNCGSAYASYTRGYKAGGFNTQMFSDVLQQRVMEHMGIAMVYDIESIVSYKPEMSNNYEVGMKCDVADRRLSFDLVGFFIDCRDRQLTAFPPGSITGRIMTNAGRTRSLGAELQMKAQPAEWLDLAASYGYTNAAFRCYYNGRQDFRGHHVPYSPDHTLFFSALWHTPLYAGGWTADVEANLRGAGRIMWNEENTASQPFYLLTGASVTLRREWLTLKLWGENLSDTRYDVFYFTSMSRSFVQRGRPVTFGVTARLNFSQN